eukprot:CCRYP_018844-RE/>CCRYP_018844-RE protein AED:0.15 eAED:0.15 QI:230/1/1/1/1/0.88/9/256/604
MIMKRAIFLCAAVARHNIECLAATQLTSVRNESITNNAVVSNRNFLRESSSRHGQHFASDENERSLQEDEVRFATLVVRDLSTRDLESSETCLPFETSCDSFTAPCCQGGCTSSNTCFCQRNNGLCFNPGKQDNLCCSNKCGSNGRCSCIGEDESCSVGDGFCCDGFSCRNGKCVNDSGSNDEMLEVLDFSASTPTVNSQMSNKYRSSNVINTCQPAGELCFYPGGSDVICCSGKCGSNRRCQSVNANSESTNSNESSTSSTSEPSSKPTRRPKRRPSRNPTKKPTTAKPSLKPSPKPQTTASSSTIFEPKSSGTTCTSGEVKLTVEIKTDRYGGDTSWFLADVNSVNKKILKVKNGTYDAFSLNSVDTCLPYGEYNFTVYDEYGDGLCCAYGDGYVRVLLDDREILNALSFRKMLSEVIKVGYDPTLEMTERDMLYLEAHNTRRKEWHESNNVSYVPLVWSHQLAFEARIWAEKLLVNCSIAGIEHEHNVLEGENLAKNVGRIETWGQLYPPTNIVGRWVEFEVKRPYPGNAHLTQALWRPSKYLGCGESVKDFRNGKCRVQVCRYARQVNLFEKSTLDFSRLNLYVHCVLVTNRAGNCDMSQ